MFRKFNFLRDNQLMNCLLGKNVQIFKTFLINLSNRERMVLTFLKNKVKVR